MKASKRHAKADGPAPEPMPEEKDYVWLAANRAFSIHKDRPQGNILIFLTGMHSIVAQDVQPQAQTVWCIVVAHINT